jgi:hypothetical protein
MAVAAVLQGTKKWDHTRGAKQLSVLQRPTHKVSVLLHAAAAAAAAAGFSVSMLASHQRASCSAPYMQLCSISVCQRCIQLQMVVPATALASAQV